MHRTLHLDMTTTNAPSVDRIAYKSALSKLDAAVCDAIAVSQASANQMAAPNWSLATKVFARLCGAGMAMMRAAPLSRWIRSDFENWDFGAVAGQACGLLDGALLFFYLVEPPKSDAELQVRIEVLNINDCSRRIELHRNLGSLKDVASFEKQKGELQQRLKANEFFLSLPKAFQNQCIDGNVLMIDSRDQILDALGYPKNHFDALYDLWTQHLHVLPMSFYRMEPNGRGTCLENSTDSAYLIQAFEVCAALLSDATDCMVEHFPEAADSRKGIESKFQPRPVTNCPTSHTTNAVPERDRPCYVKRYMIALGNPGISRWRNDPTVQELAEQRSREFINAPWDTDLSEVGQSREFAFLRDFWNMFHECTQSCVALDLIRDLSLASMEQVEPARHTVTATFWTESYLNEVYIFQCRLVDLITFIQRRYKKDVDFTEFVIEAGDSLTEFVKKELEPLVTDRGAHVHQRRHRRADPELARLGALDAMIDILGHTDLSPVREQSRQDSAKWLSTQLRHHSDLCWHLFDEVCRGFSDGILLEIDRIIVPSHLKDAPDAITKTN